jgi:hypothetical protein
MKHRALGIIFIAATLAAHAQQTQPDDPQTQQSAAPDQQRFAAQRGADPSQQKPGPGAQRPNAPVNWNHNHEVYPNTVQQIDNGDPTIEKRNCDSAPRTATVESATHAVNPNDTDYGGIFSQWHMQLVHDLLLSAEFWGLMCALVVIIVLLLYILWMMGQRDQRLRITVDIVLQLTNSRNFARYHNLRVIKIHNDLVERLNDQFERELRVNGDGPREVDSATLPVLSFLRSSGPSEDSASQPGAEAADSEEPHETSTIPSVAAASEFGIEGNTRFKALRLGKKTPVVDADAATTIQSDVDIALARANAAAADEQSPAGVEAKDDEDMVVKNRRLEAQVQALQQHKVALRNQINRLRQEKAVGGIDSTGEPK